MREEFFMDVLTDIDGAILDREEVEGSRKEVDPTILLQTEGPDGATAAISVTQDGRQVLTVTSGLAGEVSLLDHQGFCCCRPRATPLLLLTCLKHLKYVAIY